LKAYLQELVRLAPEPVSARNVAREYMQARLLESLQRQGALIPLAFHGGTALRFLYGLSRYSEDLDFALEGRREAYDFRRYLHAIRADLTAEGYAVALRVSDQRTVHSAFVRLPGLLHEIGLSPFPDEPLAVKLEVDTRPPEGAVTGTAVVRRHALLHLHHHDRASLLAGKLHAILQLPYAKGRDLYDLLWYLGDPGWPAPNLVMLNHALRQTGWGGGALDQGSWRPAVRARLAGLDWDRARQDVAPFLEPGAGAALLTPDNLLGLLA
jgi:hypothetical protein